MKKLVALVLALVCVLSLVGCGQNYDKDYLNGTVTEIHDAPFGRAIVGFVSATLIIYMSQFIIRGYYISIMSSIIAAGIYGLIDYYLPNKT